MNFTRSKLFSVSIFTAISISAFTSKPLLQDPIAQEIPFKPGDEMTKLVKSLQKKMTLELGKFDTKPFQFDHWKRKEGGYGTSAILQDGSTFEKAGVNISIIKSKAPKALIQKMSSKDIQISANDEYDFFVAGISMVIHPINPHVPTMHANYRYFELLKNDKVVNSWYGGGCDLTPSILYEDDCVHFHQLIKDACDKHDATYYTKFKKWCDEYFFNSHRGESRGIGGIFFDDLLKPGSSGSKETFEFVKDCGNVLVDQYIPIIAKRVNTPFTAEEKKWQQIRRGRYVEFNLVFSY